MLDLNSVSFSGLSLVGVVSLFGGEITLSALRYSVLASDAFLSLYVTTILSPGLQTVSLKMFRRMEDNVSRAIGGGSDDRKDIIGLSVNNNYKYVGLHSAIKMNVSSVLGEALIAADSLERINVPCSREYSSRRILKLKIIELSKKRQAFIDHGSRVQVVGEISKHKKRALYTIPLITITGIIIMLLIKDYVAFALVLLNVICNMLVTFTIRSNGIKYPTGNSARDSPRGDILVESTDGTELCLVIGEEDIIQYIFQKPLIMPPGPGYELWNYLHMLAACLSFFAAIANIVLLPSCTIGGQIVFGVLIFLGSVQNVLLSTLDKNVPLLEIMERMFEIGVKEYMFQTRTAAIAFCMLKSGSNNIEQIRHLLPDTQTFRTWLEDVAVCVGGSVNNATNVSKILSDDLLNILDIDLQDALSEYNRLYSYMMDIPA